MPGQNSHQNSKQPPEDFNPYYKWLGIPRDAQPANHYQLIGVQLFEPDAEVVQNLSDQRMAHLKSLSTGQHAPLAQRLLNEVMAATRVLLSPRLRKAYDAQLRESQLRDESGDEDDDFDHDLFNRLVNEDLLEEEELIDDDDDDDSLGPLDPGFD